MATPERLILNSVTDTAQTYGPWLEACGLVPLWGTAAESAFLAKLSRRPKTRLETIIEDLDGLKRRTDNIPGSVFRPSKDAFRWAKFYIYETYTRMRDLFPTPSFVLDGEGGIIIKWTQDGRTVRLNCFADPSNPDYIYYENGEYDVEDGITPDKLKARLEWLIHEPEPAR